MEALLGWDERRIDVGLGHLMAMERACGNAQRSQQRTWKIERWFYAFELDFLRIYEQFASDSGLIISYDNEKSYQTATKLRTYVIHAVLF